MKANGMSRRLDKLKNFQNDASFIKDFIESLAEEESVDQEFPDMVMLLGTLWKKLIYGSENGQEVRSASFKEFRKMVARIKWEENYYGAAMFQDCTAENIDKTLNTPLMRAAYRVTTSLFPSCEESNSNSWDWRAWQVFHIVSCRPYYAGLEADISEIYFQFDTPDIKPKQLLGKKIFDGILSVGFATRFDITLMMFVCWNVKRRRKLDEHAFSRRKSLSITSGNIHEISRAVKSFLDGWAEMASNIFNGSCLQNLFAPFTVFDVKKMEFVVLGQGMYANKEDNFSALHNRPVVETSQCTYEEVSNRSYEENEKIRKLAKAFFKSLWDAIDLLRSFEKSAEVFQEEYGPRERRCRRKGRIPLAVWKHLEDITIVSQDSFPGPPAGMPTFAMLPKHIVRHFIVTFQCWEWENRLRNLSLDEWPEAFQKQFSQLPLFSLLSVDEREFNVRVGPSTIPNSGLGVFANENLREGAVVGWYNGTIVYRDLELDQDLDAVYGSDRFGCTVEKFKKYALEVNRSGIFLVAPEYCVAGKVNDPRCLVKGINDSSNQPNCFFDCDGGEITSQKLQNPFLVNLKTLKYVKAGEELFVDYGENYSHWN